MSSHLLPEISAHLLAASPTRHYLEYGDWADAILEELLQIQDGLARVPDHRKNSQASGPTPRRLARSAAPAARLRADLQRLARRGRGRRCLPALLSAQRAFGDGPFLLPGARPGHPEAQNAAEPAREAQNGVDSRSGILQTPKELVESPFPLRNQTWKETFCSWTRKPNSYPSIRAGLNDAPALSVSLVRSNRNMGFERE